MKIQIKILFLFIAAFSNVVFSAGNELKPFTGSRAYALNNLYFAGSPGLNSILTNPAGLGNLKGFGAELSFADNILLNTYDSPVQGLFKSYNEDNISLAVGAYYSLSENITAAIAYLPLIDYIVDWPYSQIRSSDTSTVMLAFNMKNLIEVNSISPAIGFKFDNLTAGIAVNVLQVRHRLYLPQSNPVWPNGVTLAAYQVNSEFDTWTFSGTLGLQYSFNEDLSFGFVYKHGFKADLEGKTESRLFSDLDSLPNSVTSSTQLEIPSVFGLGALFRLDENMVLNLDVSYSLYGSLAKEMVYNFDNAGVESRLLQRDLITGLSAKTISLDYENSIDAGIGLEYVTEGGFNYRGSYRYSQSPLPSTSLNYLFPSVDTHTLAFGIGFREESLVIDASIAYTFGLDKEVAQDENTLYGKYYSSGYVPSVTLRYEL